MEEPEIGNQEAVDIDRYIKRVLADLGNPEPPLNLALVREALKLDRRYFQADDPGIIGEISHRLMVAGKQILKRPGIITDAVRKADLRAFYFPDSKRILIDQSVPKLKWRWTEAHEVGHSLIPWHEPYMFGDNYETLNPACRANIEAEANFAGARLLFLAGRFGAEARDLEPNFKNLQTLKKRYDNTLASSLWRLTRERDPDRPAFGFVGRHPRYADIGNGDACRHFIRSDGFRKRFGKITPELIYAAISAHCTYRRRGPVLEALHVFIDDNGSAHEFRIESFSNTYDLLTMGNWVRLSPSVSRAASL